MLATPARPSKLALVSTTQQSSANAALCARATLLFMSTTTAATQALTTKATVFYHSADFDGLFCKAIAEQYLPDATFIGWDFGDPVQAFPSDGTVYVMDLPVDRVFGWDFTRPAAVSDCHWQFDHAKQSRTVWLDHHQTSIACHPVDLAGLRIDGVAACRLAWQWFLYARRKAQGMIWLLPDKKQFVDRLLSEPAAVRLAGEYDVWDKRDPDAEVFQHGLRSQPLAAWHWQDLLSVGYHPVHPLLQQLLQQGVCVQYARQQSDALTIAKQGFDLQWQGLTFLACNAALYNSHLFTSAIKPHHDALLGFCLRGNGKWAVSLYGVPHRPDLDLSVIAKAHGGGGHKQACGFTTDTLPFLK